MATIEEAVAVIHQEKLDWVVVGGHCSPDEDDVDALSLRRAEAVRTKLYELGVPHTVRIDVNPRGTKEPLDALFPGTTPDPASEKNRRVDVFDADSSTRRSE